MNNRNGWRLAPLAVVAVLLLLAGAGRLVASMNAGDQPLETGPDIVILDELEDEYEPVPFDHLAHAKMAQMWNGCTTCHHRPPHPTDAGDGQTSRTLPMVVPTHSQEDAAEIPACKSCHPVALSEDNLRVPSLKGAYHRQCLNCHKEWMHENACGVCHRAKAEMDPQDRDLPPDPGDIVGRMHPPIPEPDEVPYKTRFTPADGRNTLFRHKEHTVDFGIRCVVCHQDDNCSHCHGGSADTTALKPLHTGMKWEDSHKPCMACHSQNRCNHCHFRDDKPAPPPFDHARTKQPLDKDHVGLACATCHPDWKFKAPPTCGDASCHKKGPVEYPAQLPGPMRTPTPVQPTNTTNAAGS